MKKKSNGKVTTIPGLARLMQEEFVRVHEKFDTMEMRQDRMEARQGRMEGDVNEMKKNSSELFAKLDKFIVLYQDTKQELGILAKQMRRLEGRIAQLEGKK